MATTRGGELWCGAGCQVGLRCPTSPRSIAHRRSPPSSPHFRPSARRSCPPLPPSPRPTPTVPVPALRPSSSPRLPCLCPSPIHADLAQLHPPPAPLTPHVAVCCSPPYPYTLHRCQSPQLPLGFLPPPLPMPSPSAARHLPSASRQPFPAAARRLPPRSPPGPPLPSPPAVVRTLRRILHPTVIIHANRFAPAPRRP